MRDIAYGGGIREILSRADELQRSGRDILHLEIGRPDFDSPEPAKRAAIRALESGDVHYTDMAGTPELRAEVAAKYKRDAGINVDPDSELLVTAGAIEALSTVFLTLLSPGDEVIVPAPYFPPYEDIIRMAGGVPRSVQCVIENGFRPQPADIEKTVTPRTRAILINSPNNPTGATLRADELSGIAGIAQKHGLLVVSDECYEKFTYEEGAPHIYMASLPGMRERTFTVSAASKTFSMTGWRVGWLVFPAQARQYIMKSHQSIATCANSFAQAGVAEALRSCQADVGRMICEYKRRRDLTVEMLSQINGVTVPVPSGAFYVFPSIEGLGVTSFEFCSRLLEEEGVSTVPGQPFGAPDGYFRATYCRPVDEIKEALTRVAGFAARL
ncbi:MAG: pyridoxal phosphate-dependent aminotransferase [Clostridiales Family XIII bacterium]|jgi:aspartate aminotransferase/aminotransferase|nr:pyridoxal phosphate-dependent aminotransferase [Clostridiales Family XIII bacterium]